MQADDLLGRVTSLKQKDFKQTTEISIKTSITSAPYQLSHWKVCLRRTADVFFICNCEIVVVHSATGISTLSLSCNGSLIAGASCASFISAHVQQSHRLAAATE